jgi:hypothetical protein
MNYVSNFSVNEDKFNLPHNVITNAERAYESYVANIPLPQVANLVAGSVTAWLTSATNVLDQWVAPSTSVPATSGTSTAVSATTGTSTAAPATAAPSTSLPPVAGSSAPTTGDRDHVSYSFTIKDGVVTAEQMTTTLGPTTHTSDVAIGPTTTFAIGADGTVTENLVTGHVIEHTDFKPSSAAGQYTKASVTVTDIPANGAATQLDVAPILRATYSFGNDGTISVSHHLLADGTELTVNPGSGITFNVLEPGYVMEARTIDGHSVNEVYHDGNHDGIYTGVAHGNGTTVDLVGLKAQIASGSIDHVL